MIKQRIKSILDPVPAAKVAAYIATDVIQGIQLASGQLSSDSGSTHLTRSESESLSYIETVFNDYKHYGRVAKFSGAVAEIKPGDNAGVAMLLRHEGCTQVDLIDRYYSKRNSAQQAKLYAAISRRYGLNYLKTQAEWDEQTLDGITWKIGQPAETYFKDVSQQQGLIYDFILSRAVLEHLYDPLEALRSMVNCLKPGGKMLHEIDFRDHDLFSPPNTSYFSSKFPALFIPGWYGITGGPIEFSCIVIEQL